MVRLGVLLILLGALVPAPAVACRLALLLALDVSSSVDAREYALQRNGLANALISPEVEAAFASSPDPVALAAYEWSGQWNQRVLLDWRLISSAEGLLAAAEELAAVKRGENGFPTAIGYALGFGAGMMAEAPACARRTIDLSGDGTSNVGPRPRDIKVTLPSDITLNAIVIAAPAPQQATTRNGEIAMLTNYFRSEVIRGPDAFVEAALGFDDFQAAMTRKLLKELETLAVGAAAQTTP